MTSSSLIIVLISFGLLTLAQIILISIYKSIFRNSKDEYVINLSILERLIDDYVNTVLIKEIQQNKRQYNLDPESKINSVLAFEKKCNDLIGVASLEILKMISPKTLKYLSIRFSDESLALLIINKIKQTLALN